MKKIISLVLVLAISLSLCVTFTGTASAGDYSVSVTTGTPKNFQITSGLQNIDFAKAMTIQYIPGMGVADISKVSMAPMIQWGSTIYMTVTAQSGLFMQGFDSGTVTAYLNFTSTDFYSLPEQHIITINISAAPAVNPESFTIGSPTPAFTYNSSIPYASCMLPVSKTSFSQSFPDASKFSVSALNMNGSNPSDGTVITAGTDIYGIRLVPTAAGEHFITLMYSGTVVGAALVSIYGPGYEPPAQTNPFLPGSDNIIEYPTITNPTTPTTPTTTPSTSSTTKMTAAAINAAISAIKISDTPKITVKDYNIISSEIMAELMKEENEKTVVKFQGRNDAGSLRLQFTIKGSEVTSARNYSIGITEGTRYASEIAALMGNTDYVTFQTTHRGGYGALVRMATRDIDTGDLDTDNLYLYKYRPDSNSFERIKRVIWVDSVGYLQFSLANGADYVVTDVLL